MKREIVVCLTCGRSGSSVLMALLQKCGLRLNINSLGESEQNPEGMYEDATVVELHQQVFALLNSNQYLPVIEDINKMKGIGEIKKRLTDYVEKNINADERLWGFKDPRMPLLLPLWNRILNPLKIVPKYILVVRNPSSVKNSMHTHYDEGDLAETFWLMKNIAALKHSGGNVFIVHHEDWYTDKAGSVMRDLLKYTGLDKTFAGSVENVIKQIVKPSYNRSVWDKSKIHNRWTRKLYEALEDCRGHDFDREHLMPVVHECAKVAEEFYGWNKASISRMKGQADKLSVLEKSVAKRDIQIVTLQEAKVRSERKLAQTSEELNIYLEQNVDEQGIGQVAAAKYSKLKHDLEKFQNLYRESDHKNSRLEFLMRNYSSLATLNGQQHAELEDLKLLSGKYSALAESAEKAESLLEEELCWSRRLKSSKVKMTDELILKDQSIVNLTKQVEQLTAEISQINNELEKLRIKHDKVKCAVREMIDSSDDLSGSYSGIISEMSEKHQTQTLNYSKKEVKSLAGKFGSEGIEVDSHRIPDVHVESVRNSDLMQNYFDIRYSYYYRVGILLYKARGSVMSALVFPIRLSLLLIELLFGINYLRKHKAKKSNKEQLEVKWQAEIYKLVNSIEFNMGKIFIGSFVHSWKDIPKILSQIKAIK